MSVEHDVAASITFDPTVLSYQDTQDYRHELIRSIHNPGTDWSPLDPDAAKIEQAYRNQLAKADAHLASFGFGDPSTGIEASLK